MSWLKLTEKAIYLMEGGTDYYIDRVEFTKKEGEGESGLEIKKFPYRWFSSIVTRPRTIIVDKEKVDRENNVVPSKPFSNLNFLKLFELPVNREFFDELKRCKNLDAIINKFYELMGGFSDDFFNFEYDGKDYYLLPPNITSSTNEFYNDRELTFPNIDFHEQEPDYAREEPSFAEIFLPLVWRSKLTVRPVLERFPPTTSNVRVNLVFIPQPRPGVVTQPMDLQTLDRALEPKVFDPSGNIYDYLQNTWEIGVIPFVAENQINVPLVGRIVTFTDVMDAIAVGYDAVWDWQGNFAFLKSSHN